ncbi:MAG: DUF896 domain-containing protein [Oscillospiraceae bacterium]|nr:DUF896 domain-containing protein [Oscillospiraceae bacterium]MBQ2602471.1 DUF896 domain-containing protein [Oscillospiraceae bacterium]
MTEERIARISELTRLSRERELTDEEKAERAELRQEYLAAIRASLEGQLDNTYIVSEDGTKRKVERHE